MMILFCRGQEDISVVMVEKLTLSSVVFVSREYEILDELKLKGNEYDLPRNQVYWGILVYPTHRSM